MLIVKGKVKNIKYYFHRVLIELTFFGFVFVFIKLKPKLLVAQKYHLSRKTLERKVKHERNK